MILSVFVSSLTRGLYRTWLLFFIEFDSILSVLLATFVYFFHDYGFFVVFVFIPSCCFSLV